MLIIGKMAQYLNVILYKRPNLNSIRPIDPQVTFVYILADKVSHLGDEFRALAEERSGNAEFGIRNAEFEKNEKGFWNAEIGMGNAEFKEKMEKGLEGFRD